MKILVDTHTHTNCSTHAYGTLLENLAYAKKVGLEGMCTTDHGPKTPDAPHRWHFENLEVLPDEVDGVRLFKGIEANIMNEEGEIDLGEKTLQRMDVVIASMHQTCFVPSCTESHTKAWLSVLDNPYVTILGHSGNPAYPYDYRPVIEKAKEKNVCIEINNHSFASRGRSGSYENCKEIALLCKKAGTKITVGTDAHTPFEVGVFDLALGLLKEIDFPEELIMNVNVERFSNYLAAKKAERENMA